MPRIRIDPTPRRIRARLGDTFVLDSADASLLYVEGRPPAYAVPADDVDWWSVRTGAGSATDEVGAYDPVVADRSRVVGRRYVGGAAAGLVVIDHDAADAWWEEDELLTGHPRDPYRRVDVLESSRRVEIRVHGVTVARTARPRLVVETGLPARWYVPAVDVDWSRLRPTATRTVCQYKGEARYWSVGIPGRDAAPDLAWAYDRPVPEAPKLAGLVAFDDGHDAVTTIVDGEPTSTPRFDPLWLNPIFG